MGGKGLVVGIDLDPFQVGKLFQSGNPVDTCRDIDLLQRCCLGERLEINGRPVASEGKVSQRNALVENMISHRCCSAGEDDTRQMGATAESLVRDAPYG